MKTAEEMMIEFIESEIKAYGKIKLSAKKFYKIYNWYQEVELAQVSYYEYMKNNLERRKKLYE